MCPVDPSIWACLPAVAPWKSGGSNVVTAAEPFQRQPRPASPPCQLNDDDNDNLIEYQGELDPDKNYFSQLAYHLSKSSNHYIEASFNKYVMKNNVNINDFSPIHSNTKSIPANLNNFLSYISNIAHDFSVIGFSETWLTPWNIDAYGIVVYNHAAVTREEREVAYLYSYMKTYVYWIQSLM